MEAAGDQGHAAGSADEQECSEGGGFGAGALQDAAGFVDGSGDEWGGDAVEFFAGEVQGFGAAGDGDGCGGGAGEHFFGGAYFGPEGLAVAAVDGCGGLVESLPQVGVA